MGKWRLHNQTQMQTQGSFSNTHTPPGKPCGLPHQSLDNQQQWIIFEELEDFHKSQCAIIQRCVWVGQHQDFRCLSPNVFNPKDKKTRRKGVIMSTAVTSKTWWSHHRSFSLSSFFYNEYVLAVEITVIGYISFTQGDTPQTQKWESKKKRKPSRFWYWYEGSLQSPHNWVCSILTPFLWHPWHRWGRPNTSEKSEMLQVEIKGWKELFADAGRKTI